MLRHLTPISRSVFTRPCSIHYQFSYAPSCVAYKLTFHHIEPTTPNRKLSSLTAKYFTCDQRKALLYTSSTDLFRYSLGYYSRPYSEKSADIQSNDDKESNLTVFQRFKKVYKEHGKTLIGVHIVTSVLWYSGFYLIAKSGIDLLPLIIKLGASEALQAKYTAAGDFLVAYILYEIAKPVRYLVTLAATRQTVLYLRAKGTIPPLKPEDKLRNLAKEGGENFKEKYQERREGLKGKYEDKRAEYSERWKTVRHRVGRTPNNFRFRSPPKYKPKNGKTHKR